MCRCFLFIFGTYISAYSKAICMTILSSQEMEARQRREAVGSPSASASQCDNNSGTRLYGGRSYGVSRRGFRSNFVPPVKSNGTSAGNVTSRIAGKCDDTLDDSTKRWSVVQPSH